MVRSKAEALDKIKQSAAKGAERIGAIVYWSLQDVRISVGNLEALYDRHGLDKDEWFPPRIRGYVAFRKALNDEKRKAKGERSKHRVLIRGIANTEDEISVGIVDEKVDDVATDLAYRVPCKVRFDKENETVKVTGSHPVADHLKKTYQEMTGTYISNDLLRTLVRNVHKKMRAICLRQSGGVYFVPAGELETVRRHQAVVNDIGNSEFTIIPIYGDQEAKANLGAQARRALADEIKIIQEEIEQFKTKAPRKDTLVRRVQEFNELRKRADTFADMLSVKVTDIKEGLDDCRAFVRKMLGAMEDADAAKKKAAKKAATKKQPAKVRKLKRVQAG